MEKDIHRRNTKPIRGVLKVIVAFLAVGLLFFLSTVQTKVTDSRYPRVQPQDEVAIFVSTRRSNHGIALILTKQGERISIWTEKSNEDQDYFTEYLSPGDSILSKAGSPRVLVKKPDGSKQSYIIK